MKFGYRAGELKRPSAVTISNGRNVFFPCCTIKHWFTWKACWNKLFVRLVEGDGNIWLTFYFKEISIRAHELPITLVMCHSCPPDCNRYRHSNTQSTACSFKLCILPCLIYCKYQWRSQKVLSNPMETVWNVAKLWKKCLGVFSQSPENKTWLTVFISLILDVKLLKDGWHF